jgi:DnaJ-class molecular chaperone
MPKNREIYHKACEKCNITGFLVTKTQRKCVKCEGNGWLTVDEDDRVCPECNGDGKTKHINQLECSECKGKGNFPRVVEEVSNACEYCEACNGHGKVYYWACNSDSCSMWFGAADTDTYDDWDGKHCKECDCSCIKLFDTCDECKGRKQRLRRILKDIKTGEEHEVAEWAPRDKDDESEEDDE